MCSLPLGWIIVKVNVLPEKWTRAGHSSHKMKAWICLSVIQHLDGKHMSVMLQYGFDT